MTDTTIATYAGSSSHITSAPGRRPGLTARVAKAAGRDLIYLIAVLASSIAGFAVWVAGVSVTVGLAVLAFGVLVWVPVAMALRGVASVDRGLVSWYRRRPVQARYRRPRSNGVVDHFKNAVTDPRVWADLKWVALNSVVGFVAATVAISVTAEVVSLITMPLWWWAISDPHHQYATLNLGIYTVTSTGWALVTTGIGLALAPLALLINHGVASVHSRWSHHLLAGSGGH